MYVLLRTLAVYTKLSDSSIPFLEVILRLPKISPITPIPLVHVLPSLYTDFKMFAGKEGE